MEKLRRSAPSGPVDTSKVGQSRSIETVKTREKRVALPSTRARIECGRRQTEYGLAVSTPDFTARHQGDLQLQHLDTNLAMRILFIMAS